MPTRATSSRLRLGFDLSYIASTLINHADIAELVRLFRTRFYLARKLTAEDLEDKTAETRTGHPRRAGQRRRAQRRPRILRRLPAPDRGDPRTNFFQTGAYGAAESFFSFKLSPRLIPEIPRPVPKFEIFVYSPRVEGVHLRFGDVARGSCAGRAGEEDFRHRGARPGQGAAGEERGDRADGRQGRLRAAQDASRRFA